MVLKAVFTLPKRDAYKNMHTFNQISLKTLCKSCILSECQGFVVLRKYCCGDLNYCHNINRFAKINVVIG